MTYALSRAGDLVETNKTLRNTFLLLSLTLLPTIFGSWYGMVSGLNEWVALHPVVGFISFIAVGFMLILGVHATSDSPVGVLLLLLFTFVMGALMSGAIEATLALKNGHMIVAEAVGGTAIVTFCCGLYAMVTKRDFSSWGSALFGILIALIIVGFLNLWLQLPMLSLVLSAVALILFSAYLIYDVQQVVNGGESNYVLATMSIYLDIVNIFMSLLDIFGAIDSD